MANSQPYRLTWPLSAVQVHRIDEMLAKLFKATSASTGSSSSPTTTTGDMIYNAGAGDVRLPIGTNHQVLTTNGTAPSWGLVDLVNSITGFLDISAHASGVLKQANGGNGLDTSAVLDGQVLIGTTSGHTFSLATLTGGTNVSITNSAGGITIGINTSGGTVLAPPIVVSAASQVATGSGVGVIETMEIAPAIIMEIGADSRLEIQANGNSANTITVRTDFTTQQMLQMHLVPICVVPAPGAGFMLIPVKAVFRIVQANAFGSSANVRLRYRGSTVDLITPTILPTNNAQDTVQIHTPINAFAPSTALGTASFRAGIMCDFASTAGGGGAGSTMTALITVAVVPI